MAAHRSLLALALAAVLCHSAAAFQLNVTLSLKTGKMNSTLSAFVDTANDMSVSRTFLAPCTAVVAHTHNSAEMIIVNEGTLNVGYVISVAGPPASSQLVSAVLKAGEGFTYPKGLIHYQHNPSCSPATFTATFPSAAPGTQFVARDMSVLPQNFLAAQYDNAIPAPIKARFFVDKACAARCKY